MQIIFIYKSKITNENIRLSFLNSLLNVLKTSFTIFSLMLSFILIYKNRKNYFALKAKFV